MDAAQKYSKNFVLLLAAALLLMAPFQAFAQTLNVSSTAVVVGSSSCNNFQNITVVSTGSSAQFSVSIQYASGNQEGNYLYASVAGYGTTVSSSPFTAETTNTKPVTLVIGLNSAIGAATPTAATVILQPTSGNAVNITVNYQQNSSCGPNTGSVSNGFFTVTPGNVALSTAPGGQTSQTLTVQNTYGEGFYFTPSVSPQNSWISVSNGGSNVSVSADGTTPITVSANAAATAGVGSYAGELILTPQSGFGGVLNIPVTFTVSTGSGTGTGTNTGTLSVGPPSNDSNTYSATLEYIAPTQNSGVCVSIQDTAAGANSYTTKVTTSNGNWLLANNQIQVTTTQLLAPSYNACVQLSLNPSVAYGLSSGAYQGSVAITSSSGSTATITVDYYVNATGASSGISVTAANQSTSGLVYVFPNVSTSANVVQEENFTVSAATGYGLGTAVLNSSASGFGLSNISQNGNSETFTVSSNSTGLTTGLWATTISVPSSFGSQHGSTLITVILPVGQAGATKTGGGTVTSSVAPLSLAFQQQQGSPAWESSVYWQTLTITGGQASSWNATINYASGGSGWINFESATGGSVANSSANGTFGTGPTSLVVGLYNGIGNLAPSNTPYQATINITTPSGQFSVAVTLTVTQSNTPVLLSKPGLITFSGNTGTAPAQQSAVITGSDNPNSTISPTITAGTPTESWVSATTSGNTLTTSVSLTGLATGVYSATIPITAGNYPSLTYPVVLIVNGGGGGTVTNNGPLTISPSPFTVSNITTSTSENLSVSANNTTQFTLTFQEATCLNENWLGMSETTYTANPSAITIPVTFNPSGIASGTTCTAVIELVTTGSNGATTQTVNVSMSVGTATGSGNVTVNQTSLSFPYTQGQSVPTAQTVTIVNTNSGTASIPFTVTTAENSGTSVTWLNVNTTSAETPYNSPGLSISVAPGSLGPNTYTGTVTITPTGGTPVSIGVTMTITGVATVTATPTNVAWSYTVSGSAPTPATIQVSAGGAAANFTATASSSGGWLQVSPTTGLTPNTGTANVTASTVSSALTALAPSSTPYTGTITIQGVTQGNTQATGTTIVNVSLTVTAPIPSIAGVINTASGVGGASSVLVSPGEIISLFAPTNGQNPIGPANAVQLSSATCPSPCTTVPTSMGGVQVLFLPGNFAAPLLYVSSSQINAVVPYEVSKITGANALSVEVQYLSQSSNAFPLTEVQTAPGLFMVADSQQAAVYQYSPQGIGSYNSSAAPASVKWTLVMYVTGEGAVVPAVGDGAVTQYNASANPPVPVPAAGQPTVLIGNQPATVSFYGEAPTFVSGLMQLNVLVPAGAGTGPVSVVVTIGGNSTQANTTVFLQ